MLTPAQARAAGRRAGMAAASWKFDSNTSEETYERFLDGFEDGDPEIMDEYQPPSWLSGEWAGESMNELLHIDDGDEVDEDEVDEIAELYEEAADEAYWHELQRAALAAVGDDEDDEDAEDD